MMKGTSKNCLFPRLRRQLRTRMPKAFAALTGQALLMYVIYTAVLGSGFLLRSNSCILAVVRAVLPCTHEKIRIFKGALNRVSVVFRAAPEQEMYP